MTLYLRGRSTCNQYWRASLMAASFASDPPVKNFTVVYCGGVIEISRSASRSAAGLVAMVGAVKAICRACSTATSTISCRPWPRLTVKTPERPSM